MAKYADKWKKIFPESIDNEIRPADGVDNTQAYNTDAMPQYMANDSVRFDLQNAINSQLVSNDERLKEKIDKTNSDLQSALNTEVSNRQDADKALQSRLDGNEFVKSKDSANNIALKYEQNDGEDKKTLHAYVDGVEVPLASQNGSGFPDYDNAYVLKSWQAGKETVIAPENGWIYIWDGNRNQDISVRQSDYGYPNVTMIGMNNNGLMIDNGFGKPILNVGKKIFVTTVATVHDGYASSIIPVSKGQSITVFSVEDDGCQVWFIPVKK